MNSFACFSLVAGLGLAGTAPALRTPPPAWVPPSSVATRPLSPLDFDPILTKTLPPVFFCGEAVPLHEETIARRLVSALTRQTNQEQALYRLRQRAAQFFPVIEPILVRHRVPLDFKYLPLVESALRGVAVSPKGAAGYWQFMPGTARELGLTVQAGNDERRNLTKSTHAACRYLNYLHNKLGSWTLAAAAYNNGIGAILGNMRRQGLRDYYFLRLNAETGRYLYRILAFKELFSNYRSYRMLIPDKVMAYLSRPLTPAGEPADHEILFDELALNDATQSALNVPMPEATGAGKRPTDAPLPNAADVFRGGIKARLHEAAGLERGQVWVFHLTRDGMADGKPVDEGDVLYAVVEDLDRQTNTLYLRADRLYSPGESHTYNLTLAAVDASTGRLGIKLPVVEQIRAGWILTWKAL